MSRKKVLKTVHTYNFNAILRNVKEGAAHVIDGNISPIGLILMIITAVTQDLHK